MERDVGHLGARAYPRSLCVSDEWIQFHFAQNVIGEVANDLWVVPAVAVLSVCTGSRHCVLVHLRRAYHTASKRLLMVVFLGLLRFGRKAYAYSASIALDPPHTPKAAHGVYFFHRDLLDYANFVLGKKESFSL